MTTLTLLIRINSVNQLNQIDDALKLKLAGLNVEVKITGTAASRWVQVSLLGEDEGIAVSYLAKEIGFCPTSLGNLEKFSTLKGYVVTSDKSKEELKVDVGILQPRTVDAAIPLSNLQAQLVDGRKTALRKLDELFGFCEGLPLNIRIEGIDEETNRIDASLSPRQVQIYTTWQEALLDKLIVLGATIHQIKNALKHTKLNRDIIKVEPLGVFEHVMTSKLGTDAAGLIPKIGKILKNAKFTVFNARRVRKFLES